MGLGGRKKGQRRSFHDVPYDSVVSRRAELRPQSYQDVTSGSSGKENVVQNRKSSQSALSKIVTFSWATKHQSTPPTAPSVNPSLPMGFPSPPSSSKRPARRHPAAATVTGSSSSSIYSPPSMSSMSSFASTALFEESEDSHSEATSLSSSPSSPESSPSRSRMWKVKGLVREPSGPPKRHGKASANPRLSLVVEDEREERRSSTPVPSCVQVMLAEPETPPPSHHQQQYRRVAPVPAPASSSAPARSTNARPSSSAESNSSAEADDEVSPPRSATTNSFKTKARIPSLRFEHGLAMDAAFDEVERSLERTAGLSGLGIVQLVHTGDPTSKKDRRRSKVVPLPASSLPKRSSSIMTRPRPPPLNLSASSSSFRDGAGALSPASMYSQPSPLSPPLAGAWSAGTTPTQPRFAPACLGALPPSPGRLLPSPVRESAVAAAAPSPALSSTSTVREAPSSPLPEFSVHPPTPPAPVLATHQEPVASPSSQSPSSQSPSQLSPVISEGSAVADEADERGPRMSVTLVPEKRYVKMSSRSGYQRQRRWTPQMVTTAAPSSSSPVVTAAPTPMAPLLEAAPVFASVTRKVSLPEILIREPTVPDLIALEESPCASDAVTGTPKSTAATSAPTSPASSAGETDLSDDDALQNMLAKLEQPHTPPPSTSLSTTFSNHGSFESLVDNREPRLLLASVSPLTPTVPTASPTRSGTAKAPTTTNDDMACDAALLQDLDDVLAGRKRLSSVVVPSPSPSFVSTGWATTTIDEEDEPSDGGEGSIVPSESIASLCFEDESSVVDSAYETEDEDEVDAQVLAAERKNGRMALIEALKASTFAEVDDDHDLPRDADVDVDLDIDTDDEEGAEEEEEAEVVGWTISTPRMAQDVNGYEDLASPGRVQDGGKRAVSGWPRSESISSLASAASCSTLNTISSNATSEHAVVVMAERVHCRYDSVVGLAL